MMITGPFTKATTFTPAFRLFLVMLNLYETVQ